MLVNGYPASCELCAVSSSVFYNMVYSDFASISWKCNNVSQANKCILLYCAAQKKTVFLQIVLYKKGVCFSYWFKSNDVSSRPKIVYHDRPFLLSRWNITVARAQIFWYSDQRLTYIHCWSAKCVAFSCKNCAKCISSLIQPLQNWHYF